TETESGTKVVNPDAEGVLYILDDALIFSMTTEGLDFEAAQRDNLSTNADFTAALALLPAADYNATVYIDQQVMIEALSTSDPAVAESMEAFSGLMSGIGAQVWGFTILDNTSLVM